ncbi:NAD(P)/FAD-dependent oxidoreductase [Aestuariivita boseongensis]|uniref:NAD(P)/FAD-dependent oxidoreductase n=1 Tax=Aestuariivita boseongensis TaxID=1470562 RepID=UPI0006828BDA|nr:FAD-binding oxidoreductase [Aestuariivita boseongensis]
MATAAFTTKAQYDSYDVVIIGGAIMGSATAWFLTRDPDFDGRILVIERDPSYAMCSTAHTNSCIRQQFSTELNVRISQFGAEFVTNLRDHMGDPRIPDMPIQNYGYMYLADSDGFADALRAAQKVQHAAGTPTRLMSAEEIAAEYPFYRTDDIVLGSINTVNEGYFDGGGLFDWFRRKAREGGAEYLQGEVVQIATAAGRVQGVTLADGRSIACGQLVNATGPRAALTAAMAGIALPVEPRKRFTWVFEAREKLGRPLPLTIDPSGVHVRQEGPDTYMVGCKPDPDPAVEPTDFAMDHGLWESTVWPALATRIPAFEAIRVITEWAGHYAYNTLDQNAVLGPHPELGNFHFINGFSGHGLQQSPAMGRGLAEMLVHGEYRALDLSEFSYDRVIRNEAIVERAVI